MQHEENQATQVAVNDAATEICDYCGVDTNDAEKVAAIISKHCTTDAPNGFYWRGRYEKARADAIRECRERIDALVGLEWNNGLNAMTGVVDGGYVSKSNALAALESLTKGEDHNVSLG